MTILLLSIWLLTSLILWLFAVALKVDNPAYKHYEFRIRSIFYLIAVLSSLLIGIAI
jgi:hypothetical protein